LELRSLKEKAQRHSSKIIKIKSTTTPLQQQI
jgi:hypothetical protein